MAGSTATAAAATIYNLRLPPQIFNPSLINSLMQTWFADLPATAKNPSEQNVATWFGRENTPEKRAAFDAKCHANFNEALSALSPSKLTLPPFHSAEADRNAAGTICLPFRRLDMLKPSPTAKSNPTADFNDRARTSLGLVLLLDQIPRNIFRDPESQWLVFNHYDRLARALAHCIVSDKPTPPPQLDAEEGKLAGAHNESFADLSGLHLAPFLRHSWPYRSWFYLPFQHSEDLADHDEYDRFTKGYIAEKRQEGDEEATGFAVNNDGFEQRHRVILERFGRYPHRNAALHRDMTSEEREYLDSGGDTFQAK